MNKRPFLYSLMAFLLTSCGTTGCKNITVEDFTKQQKDADEEEKDFTKPKNEHVKPNEQHKIKLDKAWEADLDKIPAKHKERKERLRAALFNFTNEARSELREVVGAIETARGQAEFMYDLTSYEFTPEEIVRLINIILTMKHMDSALIMRICKNPTRISFWDKIHFYAKERRLPSNDYKLLNRLIPKLKTEDLPK